MLTGTLPNLSREDAKAKIETAEACLWFCEQEDELCGWGEDAGSKLDKAQELKVPVIDEAKLLELLGSN